MCRQKGGDARPRILIRAMEKLALNDQNKTRDKSCNRTRPLGTEREELGTGVLIDVATRANSHGGRQRLYSDRDKSI